MLLPGGCEPLRAESPLVGFEAQLLNNHIEGVIIPFCC